MGSVNSKASLKMRPLWTSLALLLASLLHVEGYTCPSGKSKEMITLAVGESVDFSTQETDTYGKNVKCVVKFKRGKRSKCKLNFSCSAFTLTAKNSNCNKGSDFVKIGKEKFCEDNSPDVTVTGRTLNVLFRSNKRSKGGEGAECTATCIDNEEVSTTTPAASTAPPTTTPSPATTAAPTTGSTGGSNTGSKGYTQAWLRGPGDFVAHVHEGLELADASGFIAVGETSDESNFGAILVTRVDTEGNKVWSQKIGTQLSAAHTVVESGSNVIVGGGLYKASTGKMQATLMALDSATGSTVWTTSLDHSGYGAIRGVILDAGSLVCTGYVDNNEGGFLFIADGDNAKAMAWKFDLSGNLQTTTPLGVDGMQQGAKIRADPVNGGYAIAGSVWMSDQQGIVVKLNSDLSVAWSQDYGLNTGADQIFDLVVDSEGNYLLGGHTTAGVTNWDYLAIKVDGATKQQLWRKTFGQPRGFDARYIHDEMWGVSMDQEGNYLLLGGSGDEYTYSATSGGWASDIWVSYLVVVGKDGDKLYEGIYGNQAGNEAGEYLTVTSTGDIIIYTDSDTTPGFGFLKITKNA